MDAAKFVDVAVDYSSNWMEVWMLAATLPVVPFLDQLRLVSFEPFDAHVPRVALTPVFGRITPVALPPRHAPCIGTCRPPLHSSPPTRSPGRLNKDNPGFASVSKHKKTTGREHHV